MAKADVDHLTEETMNSGTRGVEPGSRLLDDTLKASVMKCQEVSCIHKEPDGPL